MYATKAYLSEAVEMVGILIRKKTLKLNSAIFLLSGPREVTGSNPTSEIKRFHISSFIKKSFFLIEIGLSCPNMHEKIHYI